MEKLPDKVVDIEVLRINRNINKRCQCDDRNYVVDTQNKEVSCGKCGARIDPYEAIEDLAYNHERLQREAQMLLDQRREITNYKINMVVFRGLESNYRGKKMLPICPHCNRAFYFEELNFWTNREIEERRRKVDLVEK